MAVPVFEIKIPRGATASGLARQYHTDLSTIKKLNPQIKNINLIYAGQPLKLPKLSLETAPKAYSTEFYNKLERLYSGAYGIEGARERLGRELETRYPHVDVWKDIYAKIPDEWEKIAFPEKVKKPEDLPKAKKSIWQKVTSFIDKKVVEPMKKAVKSTAFKFFQAIPEAPDPEKVVEGAMDLNLTSTFKPPEKPLVKLSDKESPIPSFFREKVEEGLDVFAKSSKKFFTETVPKTFTKVAGTLERGLAPLGLFIPFTGLKRDIKEAEAEFKESTDYLAGLKARDKLTSDDFLKKFKENPTAIKALLDSKTEELTRVIEEGKDKLGLDFKVEDGEFKWDEAAIEKNLRDKQAKLLETIGTDDPLVAKAIKVQADLARNTLKLSQYVAENAKDLNDWVNEPENLKQSRIKTFHKLWTEKLGTPDSLRTLDPLLTSWDEDLSQFGRSLTKIEDFYEKQVPTWLDSLKKSVPEELYSLFQKPKLSEEEKSRVETLVNELPEDKALKALESIKLLNQANTFSSIESGIFDFVHDPKTWGTILEFIHSKAKPDTEILKLINKSMELEKWLHEHDTEIKEGFIGKVNKAMGSAEGLESLEKEVSAMEELSPDARAAWLDLFSYNKKLIRHNEKIRTLTNDLAKASKAYEMSLNWEALNKSKAYSERLKSAMEKSPWQILTTPFSKATKKDFVTMLPFMLEQVGKLPLPVRAIDKWDYKKIPTPWGTKEFLLPAGTRWVRWEDVFKTYSAYWDKVLVGKAIPAALTALASYADLMSYTGEDAYLFDFKWYPEFIKKLDNKYAEAIKQCVALPGEDYLPKGMNFYTALKSGRLKEYWSKVFKHYASPEAYEYIHIGKPTRILYREGKVRIGPYTFETLDNPEQLLTLNPHLKDTRMIPAGTILKIPRFSPSPRISDIWQPDIRYQLFKSHPITFTAIDEFMPIAFDPLTYMWEWHIIKGAAVGMARGFETPKILRALKLPKKIPGLERLTVKAFGKVGTSLGRADWAFKMQRFMDFQDELYKYFRGRQILPEKWPNWTQKVLPKTEPVRYAFYKTHILTGHPISFQAGISASSELMQKTVSRPLNFLKASNLLEKAARKTGKIDEYYSAIFDLMSGSVKDPGAAVMNLLQALNLTTEDIYRLGREMPFLKEPLETFVETIASKNRVASRLKGSFEMSLKKSSRQARNYFWSIFDATDDKRGVLRAEVWKKKFPSFDAALADYEKKYLAREAPKAARDLAPEVRKGRELYYTFLKDLEDERIFFNQSKEVAKIVDGTHFHQVSMSDLKRYPLTRRKILKQGGHDLYMHVDAEKYPVFTYVPSMYKLREPKVLVDFWNDYMKLRMADLGDISYSKVGNLVKHTETKVIGQKISKRTGMKVDITKAVPVFKGDLHSLKLENAFVSNFLEEIQPKISKKALGKIGDILDAWIPKSQREIKRAPISISHREYDWQWQLPHNIEVKNWSAWATTEVKRGPKKTYAEILRFIREAASLDMMKESAVSRKQLRFYHEVLIERGAERLPYQARLHLVLLDEFGTKPILSPFLSSFLLGDFISTSQANLIVDKLRLYMNKASENSLKKYLGTVKGVKKVKVFSREYLEANPKLLETFKGDIVIPSKDLLPRELVIPRAEKIQKRFLLKAKEIPLRAIVPRALPYNPRKWAKFTAEEFEDKLADLVKEKTVDISENLRKFSRVKRKNMVGIFKSLDKADDDIVKLEWALVSTEKDAAKVPPKLQRQITALVDMYRKKKKAINFLVSDRTKRDRSLIDFLRSQEYPFRIYRPLKAKDKVLKGSELISKLKKDPVFYPLFNPNGIFTDQGALRVLAKALPRKTLPYHNEALVKEILDQLKKTASGRKLLKICQEDPTWSKRISLVYEKSGAKFLSSSDLSVLQKGTLGDIGDYFHKRAQKLLDNLGAQGISLKFSKDGYVSSAVLKSQFILGTSAIQEGMARVTHGKVLGTLTPEVKDLLTSREVLPKGLDLLDSYVKATKVNLYTDYKSFKDYMETQPRIKKLYDSRRVLEDREEFLEIKSRFLDLRINSPKEIDEYTAAFRAIGKVIEEAEEKLPPGAFKTRRLKSLKIRQEYPDRILKTLRKELRNKPDLIKERTRVARDLLAVRKALTNIEKKLLKELDGFHELLVKAGSPEYPLDEFSLKIIEQLKTGKLLKTETALKIENRITSIKDLVKRFDDQIARARGKLRKGVKKEKVTDAIPPIKRIESDWVWEKGFAFAPEDIRSVAATYGRTKFLKGEVDWKDLLELSQVSKTVLKEELDSLENLKKIAFSLQIAIKNDLMPTVREIWDYSHGRLAPALKRKVLKLNKVLKAAEKKLTPYPGYSEGTVRFLNMFPELERNLPKTWVKGRTLSELEKTLPLEEIGKKGGVIPTISIPEVPDTVPSMMETLFKLDEKKTQVVIDLTPAGELSRGPFKKEYFKFTVVHIPELSESALHQLTSPGGIPSPSEVKAFLKLRKLYLSNPKIAIWDHNPAWAKKIRTALDSYLTPTEKNYLKMYRDLFIDAERVRDMGGFPGSPFRFPRTEKGFETKLFTKEEIKRLLPGREEPAKALETYYKKVHADVAFRDLEFRLRSEHIIPKGVKYEVVDLKGKVPVLVIASDYPVVFRSHLNNIADIVRKQNSVIYLPKKKLTKGEITIREFLKKEKVPFKEVDLNAASFAKFTASYPPYLYNVGKRFRGVRQEILRIGEEKFRKFKPLEVLREEFYESTMKTLRDWYYSQKRFAPEFLQMKIKRGFHLPTPFKKRRIAGYLTDWVQYQNRKAFSPEWWSEQVDNALRLEKKALTRAIKIQTGRDTLTKSETRFIEEELKRARRTGEGIGKYVYELGKKPTFVENWRKALAAREGLVYKNAQGIYTLGGAPINAWDKLIYSQAWVKSLMKLSYAIPHLYTIVTLPLHWARSAWIRSVLYWRAAWHPRNAYDDGIRGALAAGSIRYWAQTQVQFNVATVKFLRQKLGPDFLDVLLEPFRASVKVGTKEVDEVEKLAGKGWGKWFKREMHASSKPFKVWSLADSKAASAKGVGGYLDRKLWKAAGLDKILDLESAVAKSPRLTPRGEFLTSDILDYLCQAGLFQVTSDPVYLRELVSYLPETTLFQRLVKRVRILDADVMYYAGTLENIRRVTLVNDLLFRKAMTLAEAKIKTWGYLFNYRDLTLVGRIFRYFFPFYAFNSNVVKLFLRECLKQGPRAYFAAQAFLRTWSKATEDLPDFYRDRVPIGNQMYWRPWASVFEILSFLREPKQALMEWADNPLRAPLGFGLDPAWTTFIGSATSKKYWDVSEDLKDMTGWTQDEIQRHVKDQQLKKDISGKEDIWQILFTFFPPAKLIKILFESDAKMMVDGVSWLKSKKVREWMKFFGLNVVKWDDVERFRYILFETPPHLRKHIQEELKKENPEAWRILEDQFAKSAFIKTYQAKPRNRQKALREQQEKGFLQLYFDLEEKKEGAGKLWLARNPEAAKVINKFFEEPTPWRLYGKANYNLGKLRSEITAAADMIYKPEVIARARVLGIDIPYAVPGNKKEFLAQFFDPRGNLKIGSHEEMEVIMGKDWSKKFFSKEQKNWQDLVQKRAQERYHEWLFEKVQGLSPDEKSAGWTLEQKQKYAAKMANWFALLPENIDELPDEKANPFWTAYWNYFEKYFTEEEKEMYFQSLDPWYAEYRKKMREYCKRWGSIIAKFKIKDFQFFSEFSKQPEWFKKLYFLKNPNKAKWYPFAAEWTRMLFDIQQIEDRTGVFQIEARRRASEYFWAHEDIVRLFWDKDNPGFYVYMKTWQKVIILTEAQPEKYFVVFYHQPLSFRERFFKQNPEKRLYYPFVAKWVALIQEDKKNWQERHIRTTKARDYFWADSNKRKRELYGKTKKVAPNHSILDYLKIWDNIFYKTEDNIEAYFKEFSAQPAWFIEHFFRSNLNKAVYYPVVSEWVQKIAYDKKVLEETGTSPKTATAFYRKMIKGNKKVQKAWEAENPGIIEYLDTWTKIITETEKSPESYYKLFYSQPKSFQERFFRSNRDKELYYPVLKKWVAAIELDKKNWKEKRIRTHLARDHFDSWKNTTAGKLYAKANMITGTKSMIDYLNIWEKVMEKTEETPKEFFKFFDLQPTWFKEHYLKANPLKRRYYKFAKELGEQKPEDFAHFFWKAEFEDARKAWSEDNPGFLDYMRFWKKLGSLAETGQWDLYFKVYFSKENERFRLRHWKNHPEAKERYEAFEKYQKLPSISFEEKRARRKFLKAHPALLKWWTESLSAEEAKRRSKVEHYFVLLDNVPADGKGKAYYQEVQKWKNAAKLYLERNPDVLLYLQKHSRRYTGQKSEIYNLVSSYFALDLPSQRKDFIDEHPELKSYFFNLNPPGIRAVLTLQEKYFALPKDLRHAFLDLHPELLDYWEVIKIPAPSKKLKTFENVSKKIEKSYDLFSSGKWVEGDKAREALPVVYEKPGSSDEADWLRFRTYRQAMQAWIKALRKNEFYGIYFFRQLPSWIRDLYYSRHPEKQYLSKHPLSRFLEEPLRIWESLHPRLAWAYQMLYRYGKNLPWQIEKEVRRIMIAEKQWKDRSGWSRKDWQDYWEDRALKLNEVQEWDLKNLPLLRKEIERVKKAFPLRIYRKPFSKPRVGRIYDFF